MSINGYQAEKDGRVEQTQVDGREVCSFHGSCQLETRQMIPNEQVKK
jgi:hypothetical protein